ncbi:hypothetical protein JYQ77_12610, partial [Anaerobutyricum soehngenii]|uniref:hypothetical protein n=1 Tax=Anaerobutyricum soehngenii TaxID=105843 RepID=UPI001ADDA44E
KAKIGYKRKCDVGASKNAGQAFSTKRLSSHFLFYPIFTFLLLSPSNSYFMKYLADCQPYDVIIIPFVSVSYTLLTLPTNSELLVR